MAVKFKVYQNKSRLGVACGKFRMKKHLNGLSRSVSTPVFQNMSKEWMPADLLKKCKYLFFIKIVKPVGYDSYNKDASESVYKVGLRAT